MTIENELTVYRVQNDLTQADLAEAVDVSRQTINAIETGRYDPSLELALRMARFFEARVEDLFTLEDQR